MQCVDISVILQGICRRCIAAGTLPADSPANTGQHKKEYQL
nr:MAG TPA: Leucine-rich repeat [Caudoviricetes sp.]